MSQGSIRPAGVMRIDAAELASTAGAGEREIPWRLMDAQPAAIRSADAKARPALPVGVADSLGLAGMESVPASPAGQRLR